MSQSDHELLVNAVSIARKALELAELELQEYERAPERNVFDTLEDALDEMREVLHQRASDDCEGSYNVGYDTYTQDFYVGDKRYQAWIEVEYDRHDKTYYYVDRIEFGHMEIEN